jgi:peptidoglycan/LPS O-acetylase OafA/YrhL
MRRAPKVQEEGFKLAFIEGIRGLAALYVVLGHLCSMVDPRALAGLSSDSPPWLLALMAPLWYGHLAVAAFIVLSGFCLQYSLFERKDGRIHGIAAFFKRRARRILPAYYACLGLSMLTVIFVTNRQGGMPFDLYKPMTWENVLAHVFLVHNFSPDWMYKINGVLWSIAIEVQLYLLFPLLVLALFWLRRIGLVLLTAGAAAAMLLYVPSATKLAVWYLALFALGMVAAHLAFRPFLRLGTRPALATWFGIACFGAGIYSISVTKDFFVRDALVSIAVAAWLYAGAVSPWALPVRVFSWRPLVWLGIFSYSLYLMHHPIQQALYVFRPAAVSGPVLEMAYLVAVGLPVIVIGCYVFHLLFERPFLTGRAARPVGKRVVGPIEVPLLRPSAEPAPVAVALAVVEAPEPVEARA